MTLNRLAKEGLVRRQGRLWFIVKPAVEKRKAVEIDADDDESLADAARRAYESTPIPEEVRQFFEARARLSAMYRERER